MFAEAKLRTGVAVAAFAIVVASCGQPASEDASPAPAGDTDEISIGGMAFRVLKTVETDGPPMAVTFRGPNDGYVAIGSGAVDHFVLAEDGSMAFSRVAEGLGQPRGLAYHDATLYLTDNQYQCDPVPGLDIARCPRPEPKEDAELTIIDESRGRVLSFAVNSDGSLGEMRELLEGLPIASSDHAVNGIAVDRAGALFVSIGNVDILHKNPEALDDIDHPNIDLLGTIIRLSPNGSDVRVFARGTRNVYGLVLDDEGQLYGVDNDGPTSGEAKEEEIIRFSQGAHYGYPLEGTSGPFRVRTADPLGVLDAAGSAGIEWAPNAGLPPGLLIGSGGRVSFALMEGEDLVRIEEVADTAGWTTIVKATPDGRILVGTIRPHQLVVYGPV